MVYKICGVFLLLASFLLSWQCDSVEGVLQQLELHEKVTEDGDMFLFRSHVPDATIYPLDRIARICFIGFWIFYNGTTFTNTYNAVRSDNETKKCINETFPYKSFRYGAGQETDQMAMRIFPEIGYEGKETFLTGPAFAGLQGKSVLYSGSTEWTLFQGENFNGTAFCDSRGTLLVNGHSNILSSTPLTQIGSVLRGCSPTVIRHASFIDRDSAI